jgi:hypothetical protein
VAVSNESGRWVWPPLILAITAGLALWVGRTPRAGSAEPAHGAVSPPAAETTPHEPDLK